MSSRSLMHRVSPPSEPPDGEHPQSFRLVVGGTQLRGSWYLSAIVRLQGFSSGSPAAFPRRWSPKTVTTSPWVGRSKSGCDLGPALSFKDVHHPCWGGGQAEPELYLPRGFVGQPLLQHSREAAREVLVADGITATIRALGLRLFVLVLAPRASAWVRARLQRRPP
jgi:hypothetical protein